MHSRWGHELWPTAQDTSGKEKGRQTQEEIGAKKENKQIDGAGPPGPMESGIWINWVWD